MLGVDKNVAKRWKPSWPSARRSPCSGFGGWMLLFSRRCVRVSCSPFSPVPPTQNFTHCKISPQPLQVKVSGYMCTRKGPPANRRVRRSRTGSEIRVVVIDRREPQPRRRLQGRYGRCVHPQLARTHVPPGPRTGRLTRTVMAYTAAAARLERMFRAIRAPFGPLERKFLHSQPPQAGSTHVPPDPRAGRPARTYVWHPAPPQAGSNSCSTRSTRWSARSNVSSEVPAGTARRHGGGSNPRSIHPTFAETYVRAVGDGSHPAEVART